MSLLIAIETAVIGAESAEIGDDSALASVVTRCDAANRRRFPRPPICWMNSSNTPERFPFLSIFALTWALIYACACAVFLWLSPMPPAATIGTALSRIIVAAHLPANSLVPLGIAGQLVPASRFLSVQSKQPTLKRSADWLVWWLPGGALVAAAACTYFFVRRPKSENVLCGTVVRR